MRDRDRPRGFSLIELLVVISIVGLLLSISYAALSRGGTASKETVCTSNLKQIAVALGLYYNDHTAYPPEDLPGHLAPYVGSDLSLFLCPADDDPQGDSYSPYYVCRTDHTAQDYVVGCPHHAGHQRTVTLFTSTSAQTLRSHTILWNGQPVQPGIKVGSGVLSFSDGSRVTIPAGMVIEPVQSFAQRDGRLYSIIRADINETGTLDIQVTPGSRFEVVTPSAIAGVRGTRFTVTTYIVEHNYCVSVGVSEGAVEVRDRWKRNSKKKIRAGESRKVELDRGKMAKLLKSRWKKRRKHRVDDYLYEPNDTASDTNVPSPELSSSGD